jgi:hypothetical protein
MTRQKYRLFSWIDYDKRNLQRGGSAEQIIKLILSLSPKPSFFGYVFLAKLNARILLNFLELLGGSSDFPLCSHL